jgi:hypothetical protein
MRNKAQKGYDEMVGDGMKWGSGNQERHILSLGLQRGGGKKEKNKIKMYYMIVFKPYKQNGS